MLIVVAIRPVSSEEKRIWAYGMTDGQTGLKRNLRFFIEKAEIINSRITIAFPELN